MQRATLVILVALLAILLAAAFFARQRQEIVSTPLAGLNPEEPLRVGPIVLTNGARLVIVTPELHARIDGTGEARILRNDPNRLPGQEPPEIVIKLGATGWNDLLTDLGRLKAAWATRTVGESAQGDGNQTPPDDAETLIRIDEEMANGTLRILIRLHPNDPEYEELRRILTPLRIGQ